jgi:hypothetical protein
VALAEKYGRAQQSIANFATRNADAIRRPKQVQSDEYQGLGYAEKRERLALREQLLRDIEERLQGSGFVPYSAESVFGYGGQVVA